MEVGFLIQNSKLTNTLSNIEFDSVFIYIVIPYFRILRPAVIVFSVYAKMLESTFYFGFLKNTVSGKVFLGYALAIRKISTFLYGNQSLYSILTVTKM